MLLMLLFFYYRNDDNEDAETHSEIINFEEDLYEYLEKAKAGDPYAMYQLGSYYFYKNLDPEKDLNCLANLPKLEIRQHTKF